MVVSDEDDTLKSRCAVSGLLQQHGNEAFDFQNLRGFFNEQRIKSEPEFHQPVSRDGRVRAGHSHHACVGAVTTPQKWAGEALFKSNGSKKQKQGAFLRDKEHT